MKPITINNTCATHYISFKDDAKTVKFFFFLLFSICFQFVARKPGVMTLHIIFHLATIPIRLCQAVLLLSRIKLLKCHQLVKFPKQFYPKPVNSITQLKKTKRFKLFDTDVSRQSIGSGYSWNSGHKIIGKEWPKNNRSAT